MAVEAFVGLVGGGKSYNSVRRMMSYMASGGRCCSNILLSGYDPSTRSFSSSSPVLSFLVSIGWNYQPGQYTYIPFEVMVSDSTWIQRVPAGIDRNKRTLLVIDEATDLFDTLDGGRLRADSAYREMFHFLRLSRHVHVDVLFVVQDLASINTRLRGLVSYIWRSTDMKKFRLAKIKVPFPFDLFMLQQFDRSGKYEVRREWVKKDARVFDLYESEAFNNSLSVKWDGVSVDMEKGRQKKEGIKKMSKFQMLLLLAALSLGVYNLFRSPSSSTSDAVCITNFVYSVSSNVCTLSSSPGSAVGFPSNVYLRGSYSYPSATGCQPWVVFRGLPVREGVPCEFGEVVRITPTHALLNSDNGNTRVFLLPQHEEEVNKFSPVYIRAYGGKAAAPPRPAPF